jgi:hypothetical protein
MDLKKIGRRFYQTYRKEDGTQFRGLLGKPSLTARYTNYTLNGLILFTAPNANVDLGDVFFTNFNRAVMCLDNGDEESLGRTQKCFSLKMMNARFSWKSPDVGIDKITGLPKQNGMIDKGMMYCSLEEDGQAVSTTGLYFPKYKVITNKQLKLNDVLDDKYVVTKVDKFLGVTVADVKNI